MSDCECNGCQLDLAVGRMQWAATKFKEPNARGTRIVDQFRAPGIPVAINVFYPDGKRQFHCAVCGKEIKCEV